MSARFVPRIVPSNGAADKYLGIRTRDVPKVLSAALVPRAFVKLIPCTRRALAYESVSSPYERFPVSTMSKPDDQDSRAIIVVDEGERGANKRARRYRCLEAHGNIALCVSLRPREREFTSDSFVEFQVRLNASKSEECRLGSSAIRICIQLYSAGLARGIPRSVG